MLAKTIYPSIMQIYVIVSERPHFFQLNDNFPSKTIPKDLDPSCKMDLDLLDCCGRIKLVL